MAMRMVRPGRVVGIMRETKNKWERRVPLAPMQVKELVRAGVTVIVQPSDLRVFNDREYREAGALIQEDISSAHTLMSVKEFPASKLIADKTYVLFSHTIKAQAQNMPFLDACMEKNIRLIDYEGIRDPPEKGGQRRVAFGKFAGRAGMVDGIRGLGERFLTLGYSTPFLSISNSFMYRSVENAMDDVEQAGKELAKYGLPSKMGPLSFVFTGNGKVTSGSREIFELLPHTKVTAKELPDAVAEMKSRDTIGEILCCYTEVEDLVQPVDSSKSFDKEHYYEHPGLYRPVFHEHVAPYASVIVNGMYWDQNFPRLMTVDQLRTMESQLPLGLVGCVDISMDIKGSLEFSVKATSLESPFYTYNPSNGDTQDGLDGPGVMMLGVDNLPTEFPRQASEHFSQELKPFVEHIAVPHQDMPVDQLPVELQSAVIVDKGQLTPPYKYIARLRKAKNKVAQKQTPELGHSRTYTLHGHLFDSGLINTALDLCEPESLSLTILEWSIGKDRERRSHAVVKLSASSKDKLQATEAQLIQLINDLPVAQATLEPLPFAANAPGGARALRRLSLAPEQIITTAPEKRVLVLGAGFVAAPLVEYLSRSQKNAVVLGNNVLPQAEKLLARYQRPNTQARLIDVFADKDGALEKQVKDSDLVISLLPQTAHPTVAKLCLAHNKDMVTASYVSPALRELEPELKAKGLRLLMEVGLDPGIDHMTALDFIHEAQGAGGHVHSFRSVCGGLPAPEVADNPLGYKFSWNPRGVLSASQNAAHYRLNGKLVDVAGHELLRNATPIHINTALALEQLPNRDSLVYETTYGLQDASTLFRGTLRYQGFSAVMYAFQQLGLLSETALTDLSLKATDKHTWADVLRAVSASNSAADALSSQSSSDSFLTTEVIDAAVSALRWLGLSSSEEFVDPAVTPTVVDALCEVLTRKLAYKPGERDMVLLHHDFEVHTGAGKELHTSTLLSYANEHDTAMARTVGLPCAIASQLLLEDNAVEPGISLPISPGIYKPVLKQLRREGITLQERKL